MRTFPEGTFLDGRGQALSTGPMGPTSSIGAVESRSKSSKALGDTSQ